MEWKQTIRETAGKAAHEAQKLAKIAKLNLHILSEEDKIKKAQLELGKLCHRDYVSAVDPDPAAYLPWHEKIEASDMLIAALRSEIQQLKAETSTHPVEFVVVPTETPTASPADSAEQPDVDAEYQSEEPTADCCGDSCCIGGCCSFGSNDEQDTNI